MASQMPQLYWDEELARSAQNYSRYCLWGHSSQADMITLPYEYGENIYITSWKETNFYKIIEDLANEYQFYNHHNQTCTGVCAHYTQIVWENTLRVGCALTRCKKMIRTEFDLKYNYYEWVETLGAYYFVCQYYPRGNMGIHPPYTYGKTGSMCKNGFYGESTGFDNNLANPDPPITKKAMKRIQKKKLPIRKKDVFEPEDYSQIVTSALCNNRNEICGQENRCPANKKCATKNGIEFKCLARKKRGSKKRLNTKLVDMANIEATTDNSVLSLMKTNEYKTSKAPAEKTLDATSNSRPPSSVDLPQAVTRKGSINMPYTIITPLPYKKADKVRAVLRVTSG